MNKKNYNKLTKIYQFLTGKFDNKPEHEIEEYFRIYNSNYYGVTGEHLETLKMFKGIVYKDILTKDYLKKTSLSENLQNSKLIIIFNDKVKVHEDLGIIIFYLMISQFQKNIEELIRSINGLDSTKRIHKINDDKTFQLINSDYEKLIEEFNQQSESNKYLIHLLKDTDSDYIVRYPQCTEIQMSEISEALDAAKKYNFNKLVID